MADALLSTIVTEITKKLGSAAFQEIQLVCGLRTDARNMEDTISTVKAVLVDAQQQQQQHAIDHQASDWLKKLQEVVIDADDLLDDFSTEDLRRKVMTLHKKAKKVRIFFSSSNQLLFRVKMSHKVKAIRERLNAIAETKLKFHFSIERPIEIKKRVDSHSFVRAEEVIGRNDDKKAIVELLMEYNGEENVSVFAIVGFGGLGKTALAQLVHIDEKVTKHFELKMWVCVSDVFNVKQVAEKIIESATNKKPEDLEMEGVQNELRKEIDGKKYLLVLDDVWIENRDIWLELKKLLMGGARGSKILVTTRTKLVATVVGANPQYPLQGLPEKESWTLFKQMAFGKEEEPENKRLVAIGKEILSKCAGVPLAIRTLGSLLCYKDTEEEWLSFKDKDMIKIAQDDNGILPILKLSYDHLPMYLKQCFAFCSSYPKDYKIDTQQLIQLWIAHGYIRSSDANQNLEHVGDLYLVDLVRRSFFLDVKKDDIGNIISCQMHDLIHDLAQLFFDAKGISPRRTRQLILDSNMGIDLLLSRRIPAPLSTTAINVRTFCQPSNESMKIEKLFYETIVSNFKRLRVLDMHDMDIKMIPGCLSELKHLRYLDISGNYWIETLPNSITKLQNLQTLKLSGCGQLRELPRDIRNLVSLRHLEFGGCPALIDMPRGLGQLTSLRTLTQFMVGQCNTLSELKDLNNLRGELGIGPPAGQPCRATSKHAEEANLKGKEYLQSLIFNDGYVDNCDGEFALDGDGFEELVLEGLRPHENLKKLKIKGYGGVRLPTWMSLLPNLVHISLRLCKGCKHLPKIEQLPFLQTLTLSHSTSLEYIDDNMNSGGNYNESSRRGGGGGGGRDPTTTFFPSLKYLSFYGLDNLKGWWRNKAAAEDEEEESTANINQLLLPSFPCLVESHIRHCPELTSMPLQPTVVKLSLQRVSGKVVQQQLLMMTKTTTEDAATPSSSSRGLPLSNLEELNIVCIEDLVTLPEEAFQHLTSLRVLEISACDRLTSLSRGMRHLTALQCLNICYCNELDLSDGDDNGMHFQGLTNLTSLYINGIPKLESLPAGLQHLTTLQSLSIWYCENLKRFPEWIGNLTSLQTLDITSPQLNIRWQNDTGKDWPEIAHILKAYNRQDELSAGSDSS